MHRPVTARYRPLPYPRSQGDGVDVGSPDGQGRQVPIAIRFDECGAGAESIGKGNRDLALRVRDHVPIGHHQAELVGDGHQGPGAERHARTLRNDHPHHRRMRLAGRVGAERGVAAEQAGAAHGGAGGRQQDGE